MTQTDSHYLAVVEVRNQAWTPSRPTWSAGASGRRCLAGRPAGRRPRDHAAGCAHPGRRGRRLAPVRPRQPVHGVLRLVPSEYSSGSRVHRGRLTKAGNAHLRAQLVESAWSYQHRPSVGREIARRQQGLDPQVVARAWAAQQRLSSRFRTLAAGKHTKSIVAAAIARELAGFLWAEMTPDPTPGSPLEIGRG
jgi:Transposase IS116/IS110/IS902 family